MQTRIEPVYVSDLTKKILLEPITKNFGFEQEILDDSVSRPSYVLSGNFDYFKPKRIQVFGSEEQEMLDRLIEDRDFTNIDRMVTTANPERAKVPLMIFSRNYIPPMEFIDRCEAAQILLYRSALNTTMLIANLSQILREYFAPQISVHGVMLEVSGLGVLLQGDSSIGKSETALELITRGRTRLIADDRVILYENEPGVLIGRSPKILENLMEIRGIGVVDVMSMYGSGAIKQTKRLSLVIQLQDWDKHAVYNRVGTEIEYIKFMETQIAHIVIPIHAGRNVSSLIEAAVLNYQLKKQGINSAEMFMNRLSESIAENATLEKGKNK